MNPLSWEAIALNLILHCPGTTVSFEMLCFCNCPLKANLPNARWLKGFLPKKFITFQIHAYYGTNWIRKHVDQSFCIQSKNLDIISTLKPADWLLLRVGMKSLWEWRRLSLLLFMTGSWLLCDKSPQWLLATSCHREQTCYSPHPRFFSKNHPFRVQNFINETKDIFRLWIWRTPFS